MLEAWSRLTTKASFASGPSRTLASATDSPGSLFVTVTVASLVPTSSYSSGTPRGRSITDSVRRDGRAPSKAGVKVFVRRASPAAKSKTLCRTVFPGKALSSSSTTAWTSPGKSPVRRTVRLNASPSLTVPATGSRPIVGPS